MQRQENELNGMGRKDKARMTWHGKARKGMEWQGKVMQGISCHDKARKCNAWY